MLLWITLPVFLLNFSTIQAGYKGTSITCECTTTHCLEHNTNQCNTTSVCFSQFLDRRDGSDPVVRGCIKTKTPLLCENRRPAVARGAWPLLLCCSTNMCNRDVVPTPPPWFATNRKEKNGTRDEENSLDALQSKHNDTSASNTVQASNGRLSFEAPPQTSSTTPINKKNRLSSTLPHIISPIYISVIILGIISLIVIGTVATIVLKRSNRYYAEQYGALEHQHYLKHNLVTPYNNIATPYSNLNTPYIQPISQAQCDFEDSEIESLSHCSNVHYVHVIYPNRVSNDT